MVIDVLIALILIIAIVIGFFRGAIQPLLAELCFAGTLLVLWRDRTGFASLLQRVLHANAIVSVFVALILAVVLAYLGARVGGLLHRMPLVQGADGFLGVFVHAFVAIVVCYAVLSGLVVVDKAFQPTIDNAALNSAQVESIRKQLASNPLTSSLATSADMGRLEQQAKKPGGARISETSQLNQVQSVYLDFLQPQLRGSRLAPIVLRIGQHVPGFGRVGPEDLRPAVSPSPERPASPKPA